MAPTELANPVVNRRLAVLPSAGLAMQRLCGTVEVLAEEAPYSAPSGQNQLRR